MCAGTNLAEIQIISRINRVIEMKVLYVLVLDTNKQFGRIFISVALLASEIIWIPAKLVPNRVHQKLANLKIKIAVS